MRSPNKSKKKRKTISRVLFAHKKSQALVNNAHQNSTCIEIYLSQGIVVPIEFKSAASSQF